MPGSVKPIRRSTESIVIAALSFIVTGLASMVSSAYFLWRNNMIPGLA